MEQFADLETSSLDYASRFAGPIGEWLLSVQGRIFIRMLSSRLNARRPGRSGEPEIFSLLDVGGGHGQIVRAILASELRSSCDLTVLGSDPRCADQIGEFAESDNVKFSLGSPIALPFGDGAFDFVTSFRFIPHCDDWALHLAELCRVARLGIIIDFPTYQSVNLLSPIMFRLKKLLEGNTREYLLFSRYQIERELSANGWQTVEFEGEFVLPMVLHRKLKSPKISELLERTIRSLKLNNLIGSPLILCATPKEMR